MRKNETKQQDRAGQLGQAIKQRRAELGLTQQQVVTAGGASLSLATFTAIESGKRANVRMATLSAIDRALEWRPGTAWGYLFGTPPTDNPALLVDVMSTARAMSPGEKSRALSRLLRALESVPDDDLDHLAYVAEKLATGTGSLSH